ncbi:hypothetical protein, partial [Leuconostoc lactis]|uniref:hypothetical protein n=1 Tax=Leuconostoc lactis TaxID=1246 RepID=UPI0031CF18A9
LKALRLFYSSVRFNFTIYHTQMSASEIAEDKFNRYFGSKSEAKRVRNLKKNRQKGYGRF